MLHRTFGAPVSGASYFDRPGAYLIALENGFFTAVETPRGYFLPGGGIDRGETHEACLYRECLEELGRQVCSAQPLCSADLYTTGRSHPYFHPIQYYYVGSLSEQVAPPTESDHRLQRLPVASADKLFVPAQRWAVELAAKSTGKAF